MDCGEMAGCDNCLVIWDVFMGYRASLTEKVLNAVLD